MGHVSTSGDFRATVRSQMGTQSGHNVPFIKSVSLKKKKRKAMERIKQIDKIFKKGNRKKNHAIRSLRW